ncbi:MAG: PEGA domain-containing protein [Candidatus Neomarinimicrobiota bacterium]
MRGLKAIIFGVLFCWFVIGTLLGADRLVVLDFNAEGVTTSESRTISDRMRTAMVAYSYFEVVEREKFEEIIKEQGAQLTGCFDDACVVQIGQLAGAQYMTAGNVRRVGSGLFLSVRIIDVETGKLLAQKDLVVQSTDIFKLAETAPTLANDLIQQFVDKKGLKAGAQRSAIDESTVGKIKLNVSESGVHLIIDDKSYGILPQKIISVQLPAGYHQVVIEKDGFQSWSGNVLVALGQTMEQTIALTGKGETAQQVIDWAMLNVKTQPDNAMLTIDGVEYGQTFFQGQVSPGKHQLQVTKPLYYPTIRDIDLKPGDLIPLELSLKPHFGSLKITSMPPGATFSIDGRIEIQRTPLALTQVASGQHEIILNLMDYRTYSATVLVDDEKESAIDAKMTPAFGYLNLTTTPLDASVTINDKPTGNAPLQNYKLMSGKYLLTLKADFYKTTQEEMIIADGQTLTKVIDLPPDFGSISIQAAPIGSKVLIDGKAVGVSPLFVKQIAVGSHKVRIESGEHYEPFETTLFVGLGETQVIQTALKERIGSLMITSNPPGAIIKIDGVSYKLTSGATAKTPIKLSRVWAGKRTVSLEMPGYAAAKQDVVVRENELKPLQFTLNKMVFIKPRNQALWRSAILPGFGQAYSRRYRAGAGYFAGEVVLFYVLQNQIGLYDNYQEEYRIAREDYRSAIGTPEELKVIWKHVQDSYDKMDNQYRKQQLVAAAMLGLYLWNIADAYLFMPKIGEKHVSVHPTIDGFALRLEAELP